MRVQTLGQLRRLLRPIRAGDVAGGLVAVDTETNEVVDDRFTPYGTETRIAGFSVSYDGPEGPVDLYAPVRHEPYGWARRRDLLEKADAKHGTDWVPMLLAEGVTSTGWADGRDPNIDPAEAFGLLGEAFGAEGVRWTAHNWGFDAPMFDVEGLAVPWDRLEESQFLSVFTDERPLDAWDTEAGRFVHTGHALKALGEAHLGVPADAQKLLQDALKALKLKNYAQLPLDRVLAPYACQDTRLGLDFTRLCWTRDAWQYSPETRELYERERKLLRHVVAMMRAGIRVNPDTARELGREAEARLDAAVVKANEAASALRPGMGGLALSNPEKLAGQLYSELEFPVYRDRTDTRKPTLKMVRKRATEQQAAVIDAVLDYRDVFKELTAFYRPIQQFGPEGYVHPILRQMAAVTTRMSMAKPNVQQVKKKGRVREVFVTPDDCEFGFLDYDQIEMRLAAHYSNVLPSRFEYLFTWGCTMAKRGSCKGRAPHGPKAHEHENAADLCRKVIHTGWNMNVAQKPELYLYKGFLNDPEFDPHNRMAELSGEDRDKSKTANFALLFGAGYAKLAEALDCTLDRSKELWAFFWKEAYPELLYTRDFIDERLRQVGQRSKFSHQRYIRTLKGARVYLESGYKGLNTLTQRGGREVFGQGLLDVAEFCERETGGAYRPYVPIHDEVVVCYDRQSYDVGVLKQIRDLMEAAGSESTVPLTVGCERSDVNWRKDLREAVDLPRG